MRELIQAVKLAANLCRQVQHEHIVKSEKPGREPVTIADYGSQAILCRALSQAYPNDAILAEEQSAQFLAGVAEPERRQVVRLVSEALGENVTEADVIRWLDYGRGKRAERVWAVDPIDGTKGFIALRRYTIVVGSLVNNQPVDAIMASPGYPDSGGLGKLFYTENGVAYMQSFAGGDAQPIHVSSHTTADTITIVESVESQHVDHSRMSQVYQAMNTAGVQIERLDAQDKYCMVACGDADLYVRIPPNPDYKHRTWDHAPGIALVQAAGGKVTDADGNPITFLDNGTLANSVLVISNGHLHEDALRALRQTLTTH